MLRIFIKTAGHYAPVPGDDTRVPELPAVIEQFIFDLIGAILLDSIAWVSIQSRYQVMAILIVIDLSCFKFYFIYSYLFSQFFDIFYNFYDSININTKYNILL